jgi:CMP-N-acetylneuraminic acid synthetase
MTKDGQSVLAIIPARGGSRGIPKKNIVPFGGKPLIAWTIHAARAVPAIDRVVVSSDSDEILDLSARWDAEPLKRPSQLSTDSAESLPVIKHALEVLAKEIDPGVVVFLQPTSPLRTGDDLLRALDIFLGSDADGLISVYRVDNKFLKSFFLDESGYLKGIANNEFPFMDRRLLPPIYMPNGAIYLFRRGFLNGAESLFSEKMIAFEMPAERSIDIDTPDDLKAAERSLFPPH